MLLDTRGPETFAQPSFLHPPAGATPHPIAVIPAKAGIQGGAPGWRGLLHPPNPALHAELRKGLRKRESREAGGRRPTPLTLPHMAVAPATRRLPGAASLSRPRPPRGVVQRSRGVRGGPPDPRRGALPALRRRAHHEVLSTALRPWERRYNTQRLHQSDPLGVSSEGPLRDGQASSVSRVVNEYTSLSKGLTRSSMGPRRVTAPRHGRKTRSTVREGARG